MNKDPDKRSKKESQNVFDETLKRMLRTTPEIKPKHKDKKDRRKK